MLEVIDELAQHVVHETDAYHPGARHFRVTGLDGIDAAFET